MRRHFIQKKGSKFIELWVCEWWKLYKRTITVKQHIREDFPCRRLLATKQHVGELKEGKLFGYLQCDVDVTENLSSKFVNFPPILKNTLVGKSDIGDLMENYAEEERLLSQPRKKTDIHLDITKWNTFSSSAVVLSELGLGCTKIQPFVE